MAGSFSEIPTDIRLPFVYTEFDPTQADRGLSDMSFTVLLTGQTLPTGTATPLTPYRPMTAVQGEELFGRGSQLARMVAAYLKANRVTKMVAIGVSDASEGVAATGAIVFSGAITKAAPICLYIGGSLVRIATTVGQTAAQITSATVAAINAQPDLAATAALVEGDVVLTAKHKGECGNDIDLRLNYLDEESPTGVEVEFTPFSGGSGNPSPGPTVAAWGGERYHMIAWPWQDAASLNALRDELNDRWGPLRQIDGQAVTVKTGSFAEVTTFTSGRNDKHLTIFPSEGSPTLPWVDAAASTGVLAYYGDNDPARPFQTLTIPGVLPPAVKDRWADFPERNQALFEGCSVRMTTADGLVAFKSVVTTYRYTPWGADTEAYLYLNKPLTLSYLRYDWNNYIKTKYPRHKLAGDDQAKLIAPGQPIMTPSLGKMEAIARVNEWVRRGLVEAPEDFANNLIVERDPNNPNRLNWYMTPDLVNQFRVAETLISFIL